MVIPLILYTNIKVFIEYFISDSRILQILTFDESFFDILNSIIILYLNYFLGGIVYHFEKFFFLYISNSPRIRCIFCINLINIILKFKTICIFISYGCIFI